MKRLLSIFSLILLVCILMTACGGNTSSDPDDKDILDVTIYGKLTAAVNSHEFDRLTVTATTTDNNGLLLTSIYVYETVSSGLKISYLIEKLEQFEKNDGIYTAPDSMIGLVEGAVIISDGSIVASSGDAAPIELSGATYPSFNFKEEYFASVEYTDTEFKANVTSPLAFIGMSDSCSNMNVKVAFGEGVINRIDLTYNGAGGIAVEAEYIYE